MKFLVALSCVLAVACADPTVVSPYAYTNLVNHVGSPLAYSTVSVSHNAIAAPIAHTVAHTPVAVSHSAIATPIAHTVAHTPVAVSHSAIAAAPVAYAAPVAHAVTIPAHVKTQYHSQDELGQASYGHSEPLQAHNAVQDAHGNKVGSFSYVAPDGQVIAANYVADALGYRVSSNALPVGPAAVTVDTPEVVAARVAHLNAHAVVKSRARRAVVAAHHVPLVHNAYYPYSAYSAYNTAAVGTVVNTPAHALYHQVY